METCETMDISKELNHEQLIAVHHLEGPLLVLAGAGSGKTRSVTYRIANLVDQGIPPSTILGLTFTNRAAQEMIERVQKIVHRHILICTFHSLGVRILRESIHYLDGYTSHFTIYDADDSEKLIKVCIEELDTNTTKVDAKTVKYLISEAKNNLQDEVSITIPIGTIPNQLIKNIYQLYQKKLKEYNAVDFDDLLFLPVKLLSQFPERLHHYQERWQFLLIDEYQDTNQAQYTLIKMLVAKSQNIFAVGDPDQSIYSWRGANIGNILNFEQDFPQAKVVFLEQNYRSTQMILNAANALIKTNHQRYEKNLWSDLGEGEKIKLFIGQGEHDEARFVAERIRYHHEEEQIPLNEMVIFYRTNFQSRVFEDHLLQRTLPYVIIGGISFYQRKEIKDILAFLRMILSPSDFISFARTINIPKRGIGSATLEKIRVCATKNQLSVVDFCRQLVHSSTPAFDIRLTKNQKLGLANYITILDDLIELYQKGSSVRDMIEQTINSTEYISYLTNDPETKEDRQANISELLAKAKEWGDVGDEKTLHLFLEEMSLKSHLDESFHAEDRLNLMTLHNGKGLEFKVVFIVGVEDELIPHANSRSGFNALEEERRLFYVGMTRAKKYLYFSHVIVRNMWGQSRHQRPSRFLSEIPSEYIDKIFFVEGYRQRQRISTGNTHSFEKEEVSEISASYSIGEAVFHKDFGVGIVQKTYVGSLGEMVDVLFSKENNPKSLAVKYAKLKKL